MARYLRRQSQRELIEKYRMLGESETFLDCMQQVSRAARVNRPVLIIGERGTGKELVAARLHYLSDRWDQPRITINCAAFSPELLESEIFGYEAGAFTGAIKTKPGRFELAHRGSIFLDELAQSPSSLQEKILRVLEYGEFERVGGVDTIQIDSRVIAATNRDLPTMCEQGKFRRDLLDRLSFEVITLPPLRARQDDIPLLTQYFAGKMAHEIGIDAPRFTANMMDRLIDYPWPGNIRELKNLVERAVYQSDGEIIDRVNFDPFDSPYRPIPRAGASQSTAVSPEPAPPDGEHQEGIDFKEIVENCERDWVIRALEANRFHQKNSASWLGLSYHQFRRVLKRLEIDA